MHKTNMELTEYFSAFPKVTAKYKNTIVFCIPPSGLYFADKLIKGPRLHLGAQNIHFEESGAFTGETSAKMIVDCGAEYVLVGHSERRAYFDEDDVMVNKKLKTALKNDLTAVLCIGENREQRAIGKTKNVLSRQISGALRDIDCTKKVIIAYEPVWAIGSGNPATLEEIAEAFADIKKIVPDIPILYGGSVTPDNAHEIMSLDGVDGVLVGGACLNAEKFAKICDIK